MPVTLTSFRDPIFLSSFWKELFTLQGVQLQQYTAYHPQINEKTEVINNTLETYLRCFFSDKPLLRPSYLCLADWWYNTTFHTAIRCTPFQVIYCQKSPIHLPYLFREASNEIVDRSLEAIDAIIELLMFHICQAQKG